MADNGSSADKSQTEKNDKKINGDRKSESRKEDDPGQSPKKTRKSENRTSDIDISNVGTSQGPVFKEGDMELENSLTKYATNATQDIQAVTSESDQLYTPEYVSDVSEDDQSIRSGQNFKTGADMVTDWVPDVQQHASNDVDHQTTNNSITDGEDDDTPVEVLTTGGNEEDQIERQTDIENQLMVVDHEYDIYKMDEDESDSSDNVSETTSDESEQPEPYSEGTVMIVEEEHKVEVPDDVTNTPKHQIPDEEQESSSDKSSTDESDESVDTTEDQEPQNDLEISHELIANPHINPNQECGINETSEYGLENGENGEQNIENERKQSDPDTEEERFMSAIENGTISIFIDMLSRKEELNLDINYVNSSGQNALRLAISEGYSVMVEQLLAHGVHVGDAMLRAVDVGFLETVEKIRSYAAKLPTNERLAILDCHCEDDDYHPDITPIVLAAQQNEFTIVKLLRDSGCKIKDVGSKKKKKKVSSKATDDLQKSVGSLEIFKALASEAYVAQVNEDPVEAAFKLSKKLRKLSQKDVEFKLNYLELAESADEIGTEIISYARDTEEILTVLTHHEGKANGIDDVKLGPLPKLSRAIQYDQKQFVAHPNCQQAVLSKFYGRLAFMRDRGAADRLLFLLLMILCFPFLSLLYLYVPTNWVKNYIGCPYTKFVLKLASDVFFVVLLTADIVLNQGISDDLSLQRPTNALLLIWIIGIAWREIKCIHRQKLAVFAELSHWRDILLVVLFLLGTILDIVSYNYPGNTSSEITSESKRDIHSMPNDVRIFAFHQTDLNWNNLQLYNTKNISLQQTPILHRFVRQVRKPGKGSGPATGDDQNLNLYVTGSEYLEYKWWHPKLLATAMFSLSAVISFLRMFPYLVVSDVIGPLQISLGSMVTQTAHFFFVVAVVLLSFAVGLTYIYSYYDKINSQTCQGDDNVECNTGYFTNLFFAIVYLYWSALGLEDQEPLQLSNQAQVLEAAGVVLYALFYIFLVVVLLNALIAVMSEVYNAIEENADVVWKFHSTAMWMSILLDDDIVPPPFNLLPSFESIRDFVPKYLNFKWERRGSSYPTPRKSIPTIEDIRRKSDTGDANSHYKRVMNQLVERYVTAKTADEVSVEADISFTDILGLRNDILALKLEMFQRLVETKDHIDRTTVEGSAIRDTSVTAKVVLHKAEEIHSNVDKELLKTVSNFKIAVDEHKSKLPKEPEIEELPPETTDESTQTDPPIQTPTTTQITQTKRAQTTESSTQTTSISTDSGIQTEELDFWVVLSDESDEEMMSRNIPSSPQDRSGIVSQLIGGYKAAKSRIGEGYLAAKDRVGVKNRDGENEPVLTKTDDPADVSGGSSSKPSQRKLPLPVSLESGKETKDSDYWAVVSDDSDKEGEPSSSLGPSEIVTQLVGGYETAKSRIGEGVQAVKNRVGVGTRDDQNEPPGKTNRGKAESDQSLRNPSSEAPTSERPTDGSGIFTNLFDSFSM